MGYQASSGMGMMKAAGGGARRRKYRKAMTKTAKIAKYRRRK